MARMYRVLAFFCLVTALMALWGDLTGMALIFFGQTAMFLALGFADLSERAYMTFFMVYLFVAFTGFMFYAFFGNYPKTLDGHALSTIHTCSNFIG